jgi:hypothetical protein
MSMVEYIMSSLVMSFGLFLILAIAIVQLPFAIIEDIK